MWVRRHGFWLAALAGAATTLAFAPWEVFPLAVLGPAFLFLLWDDATPRQAVRLGFAWGAGLFFAGTWWIYTAIHDFGGAPAWLAALLLLVPVAVMGSYYALLGFLATRFDRMPRLAHCLLLLPVGWTLMEWLRGWLLSGFPWLQLGYAHSDSWLAALAPIGGVHLVTFASALTAGALLVMLRGGSRERGIAIAVVIAVWGGSWAIAGRQWTTPAGAEISVALLQGAIPQDEKWQMENRAATLDRYRALNRQALGQRLIIWPESALPMLAHEADVYLAAIRAESRARNSDVLIGLLRYDFETGVIRNGLLAMSATGDAWYYKRRLVPFGEFFPVPDFVRRWMRLMSLPYYDMTPGDEHQDPLPAAGQKLGATICYEDAYGSEQLAVLGEATLLVNVTNNAWFGDSAAPHQQLQMARFRAHEAGRSLVRATSNGITAVIAPDGGIKAMAPQFVQAVLKSSVQPMTGLTPYARTGNWPILLGSLLMALICIGYPFRHEGSLRARRDRDRRPA
ncbi:MAG: apolipoprotein N-acyltransferase [Steroidobacteraceae bacterium]